jgi:hypothetical protein
MTPIAVLFLFGRCAVPEIDENGTVSLWNSKEVLAAIPLTKDGILDSCHLTDLTTNTSVKCNKWVYDNTYYHSSRAIEVCDKMFLRDVDWRLSLLFYIQYCLDHLYNNHAFLVQFMK